MDNYLQDNEFLNFPSFWPNIQVPASIDDVLLSEGKGVTSSVAGTAVELQHLSNTTSFQEPLGAQFSVPLVDFDPNPNLQPTPDIKQEIAKLQQTVQTLLKKVDEIDTCWKKLFGWTILIGQTVDTLAKRVVEAAGMRDKVVLGDLEQ